MIGRLSLLAILLLASPAWAGPQSSVPAVPPAPRAALVEVFGSADQALLFDRHSGRYQVVQPGDTFGTFVVTSIARDQVVLTASGSHSFVLPLVSRAALAEAARPPAPSEVLEPPAELTPGKPAPSPPRAAVVPGQVLNPYDTSFGPEPAAPGQSTGNQPEPAERSEVLDPYTESPTGTGQEPLDPYAEPESARPDVIDPYSSPPTIVTVPAPAASRPDRPAAKTPPTKPAKPAIRERFSLSRAELDRALEDFGSLGKEIRIQRATGGGIEVLDLARGSLFARAGLAKGDVVRKVGGRPLSSVDDAAAAYAELLSSSSLQVEIERAGRVRIVDIQLTR